MPTMSARCPGTGWRHKNWSCAHKRLGWEFAWPRGCTCHAVAYENRLCAWTAGHTVCLPLSGCQQFSFAYKIIGSSEGWLCMAEHGTTSNLEVKWNLAPMKVYTQVLTQIGVPHRSIYSYHHFHLRKTTIQWEIWHPETTQNFHISMMMSSRIGQIASAKPTSWTTFTLRNGLALTQKTQTDISM